MIYSYLIVLKVPESDKEILPDVWIKLEDFISSKTNLNKFYNIYKFVSQDNIDPITVNYYPELDKFSIHPGYNRLYASVFAKQQTITAYLFSTLPIEDIPNISKYVYSWESVEQELAVNYSKSNGYPGHLEYQTAKRNIDYNKGFKKLWILKRKETPMFQIGVPKSSEIDIIEYNESISLYKNLKFFMKRVEFYKDDFINAHPQIKL